MRVALVIEHLHPAGGGAERNCVDVTHELMKRGHDVTILAGGATRHAHAAVGDATLHVGPGKPRSAARLWRFVRWAESTLIQGGFDVSVSFTTTVAADVLQPRAGTMHETQRRNVAMRPDPASRWLKRLTQAVTPKQVALRKLEKRTLASGRVRAVAALSDYVRRQFVELGVSDDLIRVIPNAVQLAPPPPAQRKQWRVRVREGFGVPEDATAYLFAAYNPRLKGIGPLMAAHARLIEGGTRAVLLLAGEVSYPEQALAERLGVREHVRFVGQTRQMPALYAAADVTVHPTYYDPSSRIVIESLISGTPAITTRYNGAADFVTVGDALAGRVVDEPGDVPALAAAMKELADPKERKRCRDAMKGLAESLTLARHADALEALLRQLVERA